MFWAHGAGRPGVWGQVGRGNWLGMSMGNCAGLGGKHTSGNSFPFSGPLFPPIKKERLKSFLRALLADTKVLVSSDGNFSH